MQVDVASGVQLPIDGNGSLAQLRWRIESSPGTSQHETYSRLIFDLIQPSGSGLYECEVSSQLASDSGAASSLDGFQRPQTSTSAVGSSSGDKLHRLFGLVVNGK